MPYQRVIYPIMRCKVHMAESIQRPVWGREFIKLRLYSQTLLMAQLLAALAQHFGLLVVAS